MRKRKKRIQLAGNNGSGFRTICNCPHCHGAVFKYRTYGHEYVFLKRLYQCFHCSRIFYWSNKEKRLKLWVKPADGLKAQPERV